VIKLSAPSKSLANLTGGSPE